MPTRRRAMRSCRAVSSRCPACICLERPAPDNHGSGNYPVEDGGRIEPRQAMVRWEPEREGPAWASCIVELERV